MKNRITELLSNTKKPVLSVFYTAGFPNLNDTEAIAITLEAAGADLIEIGTPFSDPVADGGEGGSPIRDDQRGRPWRHEGHGLGPADPAAR